MWRHDDWPAGIAPFDYGINVSLINKDGAAVATRTAQPISTFAPMHLWAKGGYYRDNHALEIPTDLPAGDYALWVLIYDWRSANVNLPIRGTGSPADHVVIAIIHIVR